MDLTALGGQFGTVTRAEFQEPMGVCIDYESTMATVQQAVEKLNEMVIGGNKIKARILTEANCDADGNFVVKLTNVLTEDDREDADCLDESLQDLLVMAQTYGSVLDIKAEWKNDDEGVVKMHFAEVKLAEQAAKGFHGMVLGGQPIQAKFVLPLSSVEDEEYRTVILDSMLVEEDFEDPEELEESKRDIADMALKYGKLAAMTIKECKVFLEYEDVEMARKAQSNLNGMVVGGASISAAMQRVKEHEPFDPQPSMTEEESEESKTDPSEEKDDGPMFSGNKRIPERFAACKRVPKIPNQEQPRAYARINNEETSQLLIDMLGELMRLQQRAAAEKNSKARRRLVMGLREVARGIRAHKVKMVIMANNLDQYGAIDEKLQDILNLAREEEVPVLFELNKRKLGKAIGKTIKISVVGIQSADGAFEQFKKLKKVVAAFG
mmetsp:Transcript_27900/g.42916  ORF Transcript_27900/g.42916 Transcript_27900/m.42916 type:complete len:438 (+) Transcript_27900:141-1454(+)